MRFNHNDYNDYTVMHCPDEYSQEKFSEYMRDNGLRAYSKRAREKYGDEACYRFNAGTYCDYEYYYGNHLRILEFYDFDWECTEQLCSVDLSDFIDTL